MSKWGEAPDGIKEITSIISIGEGVSPMLRAAKEAAVSGVTHNEGSIVSTPMSSNPKGRGI